MLTFSGDVTEQVLTFRLEEQAGTMQLSEKLPTRFSGVALFFQKGEFLQTGLVLPAAYDRVAVLKADHLSDERVQSEVLGWIDDDSLQVSNFTAAAVSLLKAIGYRFTASVEAKPAKRGKPRHRWTAKLAEMPFSVDYLGSTATIYWVTRNELRIEAGAKMLADPPLNQDGTLGFGARFATQLRTEHQTQFQNFITTEAIILKSVNEVGLFLYFGGTNSWLQLINAQGQSIHDLTVVE